MPGLWFHDVLGEVDHVLCDLDVLDVLKILGSVPHFNVKQAGIQSPGEHDGSCRRSHCHFIPLRYSSQDLPHRPAPFQTAGFASRSFLNSASGISQCLQKAVPIGGAMMRFNIGVEITDALAMRALALQRHLAQGQ